MPEPSSAGLGMRMAEIIGVSAHRFLLVLLLQRVMGVDQQPKREREGEEKEVERSNFKLTLRQAQSSKRHWR